MTIAMAHMAHPLPLHLADQIAQLEGGEYCLLAPSGLSAINLVNSCFLSQGDEVWVADNIYGPNMEHLRNLEQRYGIHRSSLQSN